MNTMRNIYEEAEGEEAREADERGSGTGSAGSQNLRAAPALKLISMLIFKKYKIIM